MVNNNNCQFASFIPSLFFKLPLLNGYENTKAEQIIRRICNQLLHPISLEYIKCVGTLVAKLEYRWSSSMRNFDPHQGNNLKTNCR